MNPLEFALSMIDKPHRHHRHCVHNLSHDEQLAMRRRRPDGTEWSNEEMTAFGLDRGIVTITADDWEIDVPDLTWEDVNE